MPALPVRRDRHGWWQGWGGRQEWGALRSSGGSHARALVEAIRAPACLTNARAFSYACAASIRPLQLAVSPLLPIVEVDPEFEPLPIRASSPAALRRPIGKFDNLLSISALSVFCVLIAATPGAAADGARTKATTSGTTLSKGVIPTLTAEPCPTLLPFWESYSGIVNVAIPDNDPFGTLVGVAPLPAAGKTIDDVIVDVSMSHTYAGDLVLGLYYDVDNDLFGDIGPVMLMCTPGIVGCAIEDCCGCEGDLNGQYRFSDSGSGVLGEIHCVQQLPPGCYQPDPSYGPLAVFAGAPDGGQWMLYAWDD